MMQVSHVEEEVDDITIGDHVELTLAAKRAGFSRFNQATGLEQVGVAHHFSANEASLNVRVDFTSGLDGGRAPSDRPGTALIRSHGEKRHEAKQIERAADNAAQSGFGNAEIRHERLGVRLVELADLHLDLTGQGVDRNVRRVECPSCGFYQFVARGPKLIIAQIEQDE